MPLDNAQAKQIMNVSVPKWVRPPATAVADDASGVAARLPGCSDIPFSGEFMPRTLVFQGASASFFFGDAKMITDRDILILVALVRYYVLNRQQIQRLVFPNDPNGRITRRRLQVLVDEHLINRQNILFCHPSATPAPVYFPARKGCELLAEHFEDPHYLVTPTAPPIPHHTFHWLAVSDSHIALDEAIQKQEEVRLDGWINEWDVVNKDESRPEKRFQLYTLLQDRPRLVCVPDGAFLLWFKDISKVFYLEQDRATSGALQIASSKTAGYAAMAEKQLHRRHFPEGHCRSIHGTHGRAQPQAPRQPPACHSRKTGCEPVAFCGLPGLLADEASLRADLLYLRRRRAEAASEEGLRCTVACTKAYTIARPGRYARPRDCGCCRKSFENAGLRGARGSLTTFRDPWPLACPVPFRSYLAGHGRSPPLATGQGPGLRPGTPARCARPTLARREAGIISVGHSIAACHSGWRTRWCSGGALGRLLLFPLPIMDDKQETIGLTELLEEVNRDLDELRKKHSSDYNIRNITMWWDLERERLAARHSPGSVSQESTPCPGYEKNDDVVLCRLATMLVVQTTMRFLIG